MNMPNNAFDSDAR